MARSESTSRVARGGNCPRVDAETRIYYTTDNRLAHTGGTQCFDEGDNGIQTWQCTDNNPNQGERQGCILRDLVVT